MELIAILSKAICRPVDTACNLIEALLGESFKIAGDALSDHVKLWQWKNRLRIFDRAKDIMEERGIACRELEPDFLLPFVRDCGDTSAETLQEAWARLLSAAVEDESCEHIAFVNTLRNLTATDVNVLDCLIEVGYMERAERPGTIADRLDLSTDRVQLSISNLEHLGFFTPTQRRLKEFAVRFIRACVANSEALDSYLKDQNAAKSAIVMD